MWIGAVVVTLLYSQAPQPQLPPETVDMPSAPKASATPPDSATVLQAAQAAQQAAEAAQKAAQAAQQALMVMVAQQKPPPGEEAASSAEAKAQEAVEKPPSAWTTAANFGLMFLAGNSSSITLNGRLALTRKTENWILGGRAYGAYGRARPTGAEHFTDIAVQGGADFRADRRFNLMLSGYSLSGIDFDHIRFIEARPFAELGTGVIWVDNKVGNVQKTLLSTDFGLRYAYESRFRYYPTAKEIALLPPEDVPTEPRNLPNVQVVAPRAALNFRYMLTEGVTFGEDFEVLLNVIEAKRFWVNSATRVLVRLSQVFSVSTALTFKYDSEPPEGAQKLDTVLSLGLDAVF